VTDAGPHTKASHSLAAEDPAPDLLGGVDNASQLKGIIKDTRKFGSHLTAQPVFHCRISDVTHVVTAATTKADRGLAGRLAESFVPNAKTTFAIPFTSISNEALAEFLGHLGPDHCAFAANDDALSLSRSDNDGLSAVSEAWNCTCLHG